MEPGAQPLYPVVFIVGFVVVLLVTIVVAVKAAAKWRREGFTRVAQETGLMFTPYRDHTMASRFAFLHRLAQGENRYAFNLLWGNFRGHAVYAFDYHYETYSRNSDGRQTNDHYFSCLILMLERPFPELTIAREGTLSRLAQSLGYEDIDFESYEFSRTFCVRSKQKKFAFAFCHPRLMEYLLQNRDLEIEIEGHALALTFPSRLEPIQVRRNLDRLVHLRSLMPQFLFSP